MQHQQRKVKLSGRLAPISAGWFLLGIVLGHILDRFLPFNVIESTGLFVNSYDLAEKKSLFVSVAVANMLTSPAAIFMFVRHGFDFANIPLKGRLFLLLCALVLLPLALDLVPVSAGSKHHILSSVMSQMWGWLGVSLFIFMFIWCMAFFISAAITSGTTHDRNYRNLNKQ